MVGVKFTLLVGVALLSFLFAIALYVIWSRMVGLDPTVAQWCAGLSAPVRAVLAAFFGVFLGTGSMVAPSVRTGIAGILMVAAATFAGLMLFELSHQHGLGG